jgi:hypothetical protein
MTLANRPPNFRLTLLLGLGFVQLEKLMKPNQLVALARTLFAAFINFPLCYV